ncbi:lysylphosphatidylglycerol synthase transmembrane domain-containing protein [Rhodospira trueperi]|uniref:Lysylphosphatidylglycerol synthase TM region n=1 Tax=Rhodospira trueperi TaxID=69960 RepID=A0A1G7GQH6_9PROT|nr:lysylphosphatidylglycerol synthase transmembrane domain-containing protein [Rhodospira trueperi]SDE90303.1 Lysylphosphatidylglycerol synthase TM region [Rhodospira trueperi]
MRRLIIAVIVSSAGLFAVLSLTTFSEIQTTLQAMAPLSMATFFLAYLLVNYARSVRFSALVGGEAIKSMSLFPATLAHNGLTQVVPFRLGELTWPFLLRQCFGRPVSHGLSSLLSARLMDLLAVVLFGGTALLVLRFRESMDTTISTVALTALMLAALVVLIRGGTLIRFAQRMLSAVLPALPAKLGPLYDRMMVVADEAAAHLEDVARTNAIMRAALATCLVYGGTVFCQAIVLVGVGVETAILTMAVMVSLVLMTSWIPLSISGFGIVEGSWTLVLVYVADVDVGRAAATAIALRVLQLIAAMVTGLVGLAVIYARHYALQRKEQ